MKVLVTGSAGRVGRAIYVALAAAGHEVAGIDITPSSTSGLVGDFADPALLGRALAGTDAIVHTAALHAPHVPHASEATFRRINVEGTRRLLDAATAAGVRRIVFTSTTALYGSAATPPGRAGWVDETLEPQPQTVYHHTKLEAERLLAQAAAQGGPVLRVLRMSRCFPEPVQVMAAFRLHRGIDARDVAAAHLAALAHQGPASACFVVSGAPPFGRGDAGALLADAPAVLARRAPDLLAALARRGWSPPATIDRVYDPGHAISTLGWRPRFGFEEVLAQHDAGVAEVLPWRDADPVARD
ncbi:NAD(P)-dependent oxidoreductase [Pseudoxanthomonas daejeonensis]|uniref:Epimerase n=1 Tax=Pseudoxanthomonas daejeonensis TaxID=266062 RepID=A0ABQ6ZA35_9GAMM|nr:NAD(P)-dependent oxidoreductase [Pseudoxanthomonas daejeonensis]KAF1696367.1 epimerase [Pseudoxanthomonas daejeonensis]UNK57039.1 NAD(P)-dependent oxidoreductase [Pseudoxanthomonas daejeonensis]